MTTNNESTNNNYNDCVLVVYDGIAYRVYQKDERKNLEGKEVAVCYSEPNWGNALQLSAEIISIAGSVKIVRFNNIHILLEESTVPLDLKDKIKETGPVSNEITSIIDKVTDTRKKVVFHPTQDFIDGILYYGFNAGDKISVLSSDKKIRTLNECEGDGLIPITESDMYRMSQQGVFTYCSVKQPVDAAKLYNEIKEYIEKYMYLTDRRMSSFLALWIMGTYIYRVFRNYPYVHLNAEKGSGKSILMQILEPITFNGKIVIDTTGAAIFREVHHNGSTLFIDEAETLGSRSSVKSSIVSILNAGFTKGGTVARVKEKFFVYSPKMIAGIHGINDVLASRSVKLRMLRRLENETIERYIETPEVRDVQQDIRDNLYRFGLQNAASIYDRYCQNFTMEPAYKHLSNRSFDIWAPMFIIAEIVDNCADEDGKVIQEMVGFSREAIRQQTQDDTAGNELSNLLTLWEEIGNSVDSVKKEGSKEYYLTDEVYEKAIKLKLVTKGSTKTNLSQLLIRGLSAEIGTVKYEQKTKRVYIVNIEKVSDLKLRYGIV